MHTIYAFVSGPGVWISFLIFLFGGLYRLISMVVLARKKDGVVFDYMKPAPALRSIFHWIIPFASRNMRLNPVTTIFVFVFHVSLFVVPLFLLAHVILVKESWGVSWWFLPESLADILTLAVIAACVFFALRRVMLPEVKYLTSKSDYVILGIVAAPFVTGLWTAWQLPGTDIAGILHILSGEVMLAVIPFTRLSHMIFFIFTRGYMGSEFGAVRHAKDW